MLQQFEKGNHVIERTDHDFAAVSSDHAIEKDLMARFKSRDYVDSKLRGLIQYTHVV